MHTQLQFKHTCDLLANQNTYLEDDAVRCTWEVQLIQDVTINALGELAGKRVPGIAIRETDG